MEGQDLRGGDDTAHNLALRVKEGETHGRSALVGASLNFW